MDIKVCLIVLVGFLMTPLITLGFMLLVKLSKGVMEPSIVGMEDLSIELQSKSPRVLLITDTKTGIRYMVTLSDPVAPNPARPLEAVQVPK
jgi:hypothetical protein